MTHYGYHKFKVKNHIPQQAKIPPFSGKEIKIQIENDELLKGFFLLIDSKLESLESQKNSDYYTLKINLIKNKNRKITIVGEGVDGSLERVLTYIIK